MKISKNEAKRLIQQGAVSIIYPNGEIEKINDWRKKLKIINGMIIKYGKRRFKKIYIKK